MPRVARELSPEILVQPADSGVIEITIADEEVALRMPGAPVGVAVKLCTGRNRRRKRHARLTPSIDVIFFRSGAHSSVRRMTQLPLN